MDPNQKITTFAFQRSVRMFDNTRQSLPIISGIMRGANSKEDLGTNDTFLLDTGASISVLNVQYEKVFKTSDFIGYQVIQYGAGNERRLKVYAAEFLFGGNSVSLSAAVDPDLNLNNLLGNYDFMHKFKAIVFQHRLNRVRLRHD